MTEIIIQPSEGSFPNIPRYKYQIKLLYNLKYGKGQAQWTEDAALHSSVWKGIFLFKVPVNGY